MIITTANCPSCGGPINFKVGSSIVVICEFCGSAVARTDRDLRNLGKVADLIDTQSPLRVGLEGRFDGRPFVLTGRVQLQHQAGGVWDEWYASFGDVGWGWLAEAQGRFYMTFPQRLQDGALVPPFEHLQPGQSVSVPGSPARFVISETGVARVGGAQGEIPYAVTPGLQYRYADATGEGGLFATLDYRQMPAIVFLGREVTLREMGISTVVDEFDAEKRQVKAVRLTCPHCNGPMDLRVPDASQRATCPNCNSLLDVNRGNLTYLSTLQSRAVPKIPLGSEGELEGVNLTLVGFMTRATQVEGTWYAWEEYLLYNPQIGFRWLMCTDGHWTYVRGIAPAEVEVHGRVVVYATKTYRQVEDTVRAIVMYVQGEFYWKVECGETVDATDYARPPDLISSEVSASEINWSLATYVPKAEIERIFGVTGLPEPTGTNPAQGLPSDSSNWLSCLVLLIVLIVILIIIIACCSTGGVTGGGSRSPGGYGTSSSGGYSGGK